MNDNDGDEEVLVYEESGRSRHVVTADSGH